MESKESLSRGCCISQQTAPMADRTGAGVGPLCLFPIFGTRQWLELQWKQSSGAGWWQREGAGPQLWALPWLSALVQQHPAWLSSPRHQAKGLLLQCIKGLQGLASALRLLLPGLVKRLRNAQTREINLLHLSSKIIASGLQRRRKIFVL